MTTALGLWRKVIRIHLPVARLLMFGVVKWTPVFCARAVDRRRSWVVASKSAVRPASSRHPFPLEYRGQIMYVCHEMRTLALMMPCKWL